MVPFVCGAADFAFGLSESNAHPGSSGQSVISLWDITDSCHNQPNREVYQELPTHMRAAGAIACIAKQLFEVAEE